MKKISYLVVLVLIAGSVFTSCKKDKDTAEKFSTQSVEEDKAIVEESGIQFADVLSRMADVQTIGVMQSFGNLHSSEPTKGFLFSQDTKFLAVMNAFGSASCDHSLNKLFDAIIAPGDLKSEPETIQEFWNDNVGTYTWNTTNDDWDITLGGNKVIFLFPSSESSATNNATLTISNYEGVTISNPVDEEYTGDLPVKLNVELKVGSTVLVTYLYTASYNNDGIPNAIASDLTIENFKFEIDVTNNNSVVSVNYKFSENNNTVIDMGATGNGLFTQANYDNNTTHHTENYSYVCDYTYNPNTQQYTEVYCNGTDEWDETDFEEIIHSANAHFQLFNIALRGDIDIKGLVDQLNILDEDEDMEEPDYYDATAEKINQYLNLRLVNITNNTIMAKAEAYVVHETQYDWDDYYIDFRLTFGDSSPVDMQTYFENGFSDFVDELNNVISDINSHYDANLEPIDY